MNNTPDYRLRHILHKGDKIHADGEVYTITGEPLGFGGTSILYPAISDDSKLEIAIKEAFPGGAARYHRSGGVVRPADPKDAGALGQLEQYRKQLQKEMELGQTIRNSSIRAIGLWKNLVLSAITVAGETFTEVSDGIYSILERMDQKGKTFNQLLQYISEPPSEDAPLKTGFLPKVHTTALMMEQVLLALQRVHTAGENGFLFGDIQDGNVFFSDCRLEQGDIGIGNLLDFGCARPLVDGNQTEEITDRQVFSTMGFIPPEILDPEKNNGTLRLTRAADIYSVGCLMLRCVLSSASIRCFGASPLVDNEVIDGESASRLGCPESIRNLLNNILNKALQTEPEDRYPDTDVMLEDIKRLILEVQPPKKQLNLSLSTLAPGEFRGRQEEIQEIDRRIRELRKPIELYGFGGMGKSELAIEYCRRKKEAANIHVYFVRFDRSIRNTIIGPIADAFSGYSRFTEQGLPKPEHLVYFEVMKMLGQLSYDDILCIDNVDSETEEFSTLCGPSYTELCSLRTNIIITTRFDRKEFGGIEVGTLQRKHLYELMTYILRDSPITLTTKQMDDLIQVVDSHTLAVELIARTLKTNRPRLTAEEMLKKLKSGNLGGDRLARVSSHKDRDLQKRHIEDHIRILFNITNLPQEELSYMEYSFCIPDTGIDLELFIAACPHFDQDGFNHLLERGWLRLNEASDILSVHPLVKEVIKKACNLTYSDVCEFINSLSKSIDNQTDRVKQVIDVYDRILNTLTVPEITLTDYQNQKYAWAFSETQTILGVMPDNLLIKVPYEFCELVSSNRAPAYVPVWKEHDFLSETFVPTYMTKIILSLIYRDFLVSPEEHAKLIERDKKKIEDIGETFEKDLTCLFTPFSAIEAEQSGRGAYAKQLYLGKTFRVLGKPETALIHLQRAWTVMEQIAPYADRYPQGFLEEYTDICLSLGNIYVDLQRYKEGFEFFSRAAQRDSATGYNNLAWMHLHGHGMPQNLSDAIELFKIAANHPQNPSQASNRHLGRLYLGVHPAAPDFDGIDPVKALHYLKRAKELGTEDVDDLIETARQMIDEL